MLKNRYLLILLAILLCSCSVGDLNSQYGKALKRLNNKPNYTISEKADGKAYLYEFDYDVVHYVSDQIDAYYYKDNNEYYELKYNSQSNSYVNSVIDIKDIDAYKLINRFNEIKTIIDDSEFIYNGSEYESNRIASSYRYNDQDHKIEKMQIDIRDGKLFYYYEYYDIGNKKCSDVIYVTEYEKTSVSLPKN